MIRYLLIGLTTLLLAGLTTAHAQSARVVLFEDPAVSTDRLHYPLLISEQRGFRIRCASQEDEDAVVSGLGVVTPPSQILTAVDEDVIAADPTSNPLLCPSSAEFQIKVFAHDGPEGLVHYLQFPSAIGSTSFNDRIYVPGCVGLVEALKIDLDQAQIADPTPFYHGKIHEISCLKGIPIQSEPKTFSQWCTNKNMTDGEKRTVMAILEMTPGGVSAIGKTKACEIADNFLSATTSLLLNDKGLQSLEPISVLSKLTTLTVANNSISDITPLMKLLKLSILDVSNNEISNLAALAQLAELTSLDLSNNKIEDIRVLSSADALTSLNLDGNKVQELYPLEYLSRLKKLSLAGNSLESEMLEPLIALGNLNYLDLSYNNIHRFDHLGELPSTLEIKLNGNPIEIAEKSFEDICVESINHSTPYGTTIRKLVSHTKQKTCKEANNKLASSGSLNLSGMGISDIGPISTLKHIIDLDLSDNSIDNIEPLSNLTNIAELNLSGNNIKDIKPIHSIVNLITLNVANNPIELDGYISACLLRLYTESTLSDAQKLEVDALFNLGSPQSCYQSANLLKEIKSVELDGKGLKSLEFFSILENVHTLSLNNNELHDLSALHFLPKLKKLYAKYNKIAMFEPVGYLSNLELLSLDGNPLNSFIKIHNMSELKVLEFSSTNIDRLFSIKSMPELETIYAFNVDFLFRGFRDFCLAHQIDKQTNSNILQFSLSHFMDSIEDQMLADGVDPSDCRKAINWVENIEILNLNRKSLTRIIPFRDFISLRELYLSGNMISDIISDVDLFPRSRERGFWPSKLEKLSLSGNQLSAFPFTTEELIGNLSYSRRLRSLDLSNNKISIPLDFYHLSSALRRLEKLNLRNNQIVDPSFLYPYVRYRKLRDVDLRDNEILDEKYVTQLLKGNTAKIDLRNNGICQRWEVGLYNDENLSIPCTSDDVQSRSYSGYSYDKLDPTISY